MTYDCFDVTIEDHIAHVRLNRPEDMNVLNATSWVECRRIFEELDSNPAVRVAVLASTGKHFTAGIDLEFLGSLVPGPRDEAARTANRVYRKIAELQSAFSAIANCRVPVLAAVQGGCIGAGVDMVSACDMRYCTTDAYFCIQEVNIGMVADVGTLQRMPLQIPQGLMRELAYTGRKLRAGEARTVGFVNAVTDDQQELVTHVMKIATRIAAKSPLAVTGTKEVLNQAIRRQVNDGLDYIAAWNAGQLSLVDVVRGGKAALARSRTEYDDLLE